MKKLLNCSCKLDHIEEAECIGTVFRYGVHEELYQKETGEFFLYGKGGPSTKYAKHCCGNLISGSNVRPLSFESARKWAHENLSAEEYENAFGKANKTT